MSNTRIIEILLSDELEGTPWAIGVCPPHPSFPGYSFLQAKKVSFSEEIRNGLRRKDRKIKPHVVIKLSTSSILDVS